MSKLHVRKDDTVVVITGKEKGKKGKIIHTEPKKNRVIIAGVNMVTRHKKPSKMGEEGGRIPQAAPLDASNVMLYCEKCKKGVRVSHQIQGDKKVRVCKKCGATI